QTSFDKHKGFTLLPPRIAEESILSGTFIDLHMVTEPHCVRAFLRLEFVQYSTFYRRPPSTILLFLMAAWL
ncbi:hypothetical protein, partial [Shewanella sairae]|uniref:hypothetical protein n=1 Tax=Shewanella sairae TaxID=190310 RepID=UPI001C80904B